VALRAPRRWGRVGLLGELKPEEAGVLVDAVDLVAVDFRLAEHDCGESIPALRSSASVTGSSPALSKRASKRTCWASTSTIPRIVAQCVALRCSVWGRDG
jgi:hypothetical protein